MLANQMKISLLIMFFSLFLMACERALLPEEVTEGFWQAIQEENLNKIKRFTLEQDIELIAEPIQIGELETGRIIIDGNEASVETILVIKEEQASIERMLETFLVKEDGTWRVNYTETMEQLIVEDEVGALIEGLQELGEQATEVLSESIEQMTDVLPEVREEIERVEQEMKEALPEFREKLKGVLDSLQEALEKLPDAQDKSVESETTDVEQHQI